MISNTSYSRIYFQLFYLNLIMTSIGSCVDKRGRYEVTWTTWLTGTEPVVPSCSIVVPLDEFTPVTVPV